MAVNSPASNPSKIFNTSLGLMGLAIASTALTPSLLADAAGRAKPATGTMTCAQQLIDENRLLQARAALLNDLKDDAATTPEQKARAMDLLDQVHARIGSLSEVQMSVQKSELSLSEGDLRLAERHARIVLNRADASESEKSRATLVLATTKAQRDAIEPRVSEMIASASKQFDAAQFEQARATLATVYRSGVTMSVADRGIADNIQVKLMDMDARTGARGMVALAQPGTVKRDTPPTPAPAAEPTKPAEPAQPTEPAKANQPEPLPQMTPVGEQPKAAEPAKAADPAPAEPTKPAEQPAAQPTGEAPAPAAAPVDDMMQMAMKADAQRTLAEADAAFDAGRYAEAMRKYQAAAGAQRSSLAAADAERADRRLAECKVRLRDNTGGTLADDTVKSMELIRQRATSEFAFQFAEAGKALAAGDFKRARDLNAGASVAVKNSRTVFSQTELDAFEKQVNDLNAQIGTSEDLARITESKSKEEAAKLDAQTAQERLKEDRERRIVDAINRVRELQRDRKYVEALAVLDNVLFLDPNNATASLLRDVINDVRQYQQYDFHKRKQGDGFQQSKLDTFSASIPPIYMMQFPANWPNKTFTRTEQLGMIESPENRKAMASLESSKIPVKFAGNNLEDVLKYIGTNAKVDIAPNWESLRSIGVDRNARVSLSLTNDIPARVALEKVISMVRSDPGTKLDYAINNGMIDVSSADAIKRQTTSLPYNITDLLLETPDFKDVPELDLARIMAHKADLDTKSGPFVKASMRDDRSERSDRIRKITTMIQRTIDPESWRDAGGESGAIDELNGTLVITQTPRNHAAISGLLSKLREIRSMQINIESRFLLVSQDYFEQIGFKVDVFLNAGSNQVLTAQANDANIRPGDFFDFASATGLRRVLDSSNYSPGGTTNPPQNGATITPTRALQNTALPSPWSPIGIGNNTFGLSQGLLPATGFARDIISSAPALGIAGQFLDDIQVDFMVKATQADRRTITLTAPRLTLTNGQTSNVYVVTQRAIITDLTPVTGDSAVGFDPTTGTVPEGVVMLVEAVVSADRRFVTMNIDTALNTIKEIVNQRISAVVGGALVSSAETGSFIQLPVVTTTRVQTTATVPDEGTLLLGGQRLVTEFDIETGVPVLSKLPIINRFFTNRIQSKEESTLMVLVKPTILIQPEEEEKQFPGMLDTARGSLGN